MIDEYPSDPWDETIKSYPDTLLAARQWMGKLEGEKMPFAPWGEKDHESTDDDKDDRFKWSIEDNYLDGDRIAIAEDHPRLDSRLFIQRARDRFAFVDGDDVRCPETGQVADEFVEILSRLGVTYCDVSNSGTGVHAYYIGELPVEDQGEAVFDLDCGPVGENDDQPSVEIYANTHVNITTGRRVVGTRDDLVEWDSDAVRSVLDEYDAVKDSPDTGGGTDLSQYEPTVSDSDDTAGDARDIIAAIDDLRPADMPLRTRKVGEDSTGWEKYDPSSYRHSKGNDSLHSPPNDPLFYDMKKNEEFGVLQLFAAEQGIISKPWKRLTGSDWWDAVDAAREQGAPIPEFEPDRTPTPAQLIAKHSDEYDRAEDVPEHILSGGSDGEADAGAGGEGETTQDDTDDDDADESAWDEIYETYRNAGELDERLPARWSAKEQINEDHYWLNTVENDVLWRYDTEAGIYIDDGEQFARERLTSKLREQYRSQEKNEILAQLRGDVTVSADEMGGPEGLIAAENCVIDLIDQERRPHSPDYRFMASLNTEFDPSAEAPRFMQFLAEVVPDDTERQKLQEFAGYTLMHWALPHHKALFVVGPTASGKSTFLDTINAMLGADTVASLTPQEITSERFSTAELRKKWANIRNDIPASTVEETGTFKEVVGGDPMKAERKGKDPFRFEPTAKHLFAANELPSTETDDEAFYRRILLVPFPDTIPREDREGDLDDKLQNELPGVLNWAVEGLQRLLANGRFTGDRSPGRTQDTWEKWADSVTRFKKTALAESTDGDPLPKSVVYATYLQFCRQEQIPSNKQRKMTRELKLSGVEDGRAYIDGKRKRCFTNVQWTSRGEQLLESARSDSSESGSDGSGSGGGSAVSLSGWDDE